MNATAGWFPDPAGSVDTFRWWDGQGWTRWLTADAASLPPGPEPVQTLVRDSEPTPPSGAPGPVDVAASSSGRAIRIPVAVAMIVGVLVAALVVVGLTVILTEDRIRTGPALAPPSATPPAGLLLDPSTRALRIENVQLVLPGAPYECGDQPRTMSPSFTSVLTCDAAVHTDYAGTDDWYANTGMGIVDDSLVVPDDLARTAQNLYGSLRRQFFSGQRTTLQKFGRLQNAVDRDRGVFLGGELHYAIKGLPSRYDRMVLGVIELPAGRHVAFFSVRPDDTPEATLDVLNRSIETLAAR